MVKIDAVLLSSKYSKQLNKHSYKELPVQNINPTVNKPKLVHPITTCDRFLLHTISFGRKAFVHHPFISILICLILIIVPIFFWPEINCIEICGDTIKNDFGAFFHNFDQKDDNSTNIFGFNTVNNVLLETVKSPPPLPLPGMCGNISNIERFDCFPRGKANESSCNLRGCCWAMPQGKSNESSFTDLNIPYCFYPNSYSNYQFVNISVNDLGATAYLKMIFNSTYPRDIEYVKLDFMYETENRLHVKVCLLFIYFFEVASLRCRKNLSL